MTEHSPATVELDGHRLDGAELALLDAYWRAADRADRRGCLVTARASDS